jgi:ADP-heptose:LPS heptosyltransferase
MFSPLYEGHPHIDRVYGFSRNKGLGGLKQLFDFVKQINQEEPIDLFLDLHGTLRSLFLRLRFFSIPRLFIDKRTFERGILTTFKLNILSQQGLGNDKRQGLGHRYGELLLARTVNDFLGIFNLSGVRKKPNGQLSSVVQTYYDDPQFSLQKWGLEGKEKKYIVYVPSASFPEKRWPPEYFLDLMRSKLVDLKFSHLSFVVLAGPADKFCDLFNPLTKEFSGRFFNLQGKSDFVETTMLVKKALFVVGNDTGVPHIAEAVGTPSLFILGPTGEEFGFYPHLHQSQLAMKRLWCRPCTTNGKGNCIRSERFCLTQISPSEVSSIMNKMLDQLC